MVGWCTKHLVNQRYLQLNHNYIDILRILLRLLLKSFAASSRKSTLIFTIASAVTPRHLQSDTISGRAHSVSQILAFVKKICASWNTSQWTLELLRADTLWFCSSHKYATSTKSPNSRGNCSNSHTIIFSWGWLFYILWPTERACPLIAAFATGSWNVKGLATPVFFGLNIRQSVSPILRRSW